MFLLACSSQPVTDEPIRPERDGDDDPDDSEPVVDDSEPVVDDSEASTFTCEAATVGSTSVQTAVLWDPAESPIPVTP